MDLRQTIFRRLTSFYAFSAFFVVVVLGMLLYIQYSEEWNTKSDMLSSQEMALPARRGDILASDGAPLATSVPHYQIRMDLGVPALKKSFYGQVNALATSLSGYFHDRSAASYASRLKRAYENQERYFLVTPYKVNHDGLQKIRKFPIFKNGQFKGGLIPEEDYERVYPLGNPESRTIGKLGEGEIDGKPAKVGVFGLEESFDKILRGEDGVAMNQNVSGRSMRVHLQEPVEGRDIVTTLVVKLQDHLSNSLRKTLEQTRADYGTAILMEVSTGDICAIANYGRNSRGELVQGYQNYAVGNSGCSEPGSTFKLASMMAVMEEGDVDTSTIVKTGNGTWKISRDATVKDSDYKKTGGHGTVSMKRAFELSSNVGMAKLVTEVYKDRPNDFVDRIEEFGLTQKLDIGLSGVASTYIKRKGDKLWSGTTLAWMSFGYELKVTPLQTLTFYNAIANNGKMMKPRLVKGIAENGKIVEEFDTEVLISSVCSNRTLRKARAMLEGVVERGTATTIKTEQYKIAGKTGTAQVANKKEGYNHKGQKVYQASFAGYFPADKPLYSCIVVINGPKGGNYYGATVAGPVFRRIADYVYAYEVGKDERNVLADKDFEPRYPTRSAGRKSEVKEVLEELGLMNGWAFNKSEWVETVAEEDGVALKSRELKPNAIPDVRGMGASDALYLLEKSGLRVEIRGVGKVKAQSLRAGDPLRKGQLITLKLG